MVVPVSVDAITDLPCGLGTLEIVSMIVNACTCVHPWHRRYNHESSIGLQPSGEDGYGGTTPQLRRSRSVQLYTNPNSTDGLLAKANDDEGKNPS
jgi:hypothetical protein